MATISLQLSIDMKSLLQGVLRVKERRFCILTTKHSKNIAYGGPLLSMAYVRDKIQYYTMRMLR